MNYDNLTCVSNLNYLIMTTHEFVFLKNNFILFFQTIAWEYVARKFLALKHENTGRREEVSVFKYLLLLLSPKAPKKPQHSC